MTPEQKLKHLILLNAAEFDAEREFDRVDVSNVDELYQDLIEDELHWDAESEMRSGEVETGITCEWSRHYESKSVAVQYIDGSWVGWTYWYGGGKHGEPESIDWIDQAYDVGCVEEEKLVTVRTFAKVDPFSRPHGCCAPVTGKRFCGLLSIG